MTQQTHSTSPATSTTISVPQLRTVFEGRVIAPDDAAYDEARTVFYGGIDRRPAIIVRVKDAADVSQVVSIARERGWNWPSAAPVTALPTGDLARPIGDEGARDRRRGTHRVGPDGPDRGRVHGCDRGPRPRD